MALLIKSIIMKFLLCIILNLLFNSLFVPKTYIAKVFIDNSNLINYHLENDRVIQADYLKKNGKIAEQINYAFSSTGALLNVVFKGNKFIGGSGSNVLREKKIFNDAVVQSRLVNERLKIKIPLQMINLNILSDISYLFSSVKTYKETMSGNNRVLIIDNINMSYRFYPSELERFITTTNKLKKYTVIVKNNVIVREEIFFDDGLLTRTYKWKNSKELNIVIDCNYEDGSRFSLTKKIILVNGK